MRVIPAIGLAVAGLLSACATSLPPELADPLGHVRAVEDRSAVATDDMIVPDLTVEAEAAIYAGEPGRACEILRRAAQGGDRSVLPQLVTCVFASGEVTRAHAIADVYDVEGPERIVVETALRARAGQPLDEEALNAALESDPHDPRLWNLLGAEYERQGRDAEAVDAYIQAQRLNG